MVIQVRFDVRYIIGITYAFTFIITMVACGGGEGGTISGNSADISSRSLPGKILTIDRDSDRVWRLNFATEQFSLHDSGSIKQRIDSVETTADLKISPAPSFPGLVYSINRCIRTDQSGLFHDSCIIVEDEEENLYTLIRLGDEIIGFGRLSPDGNYVLFQRDLSNGLTEFNLYETRVGQFTDSFTFLQLPRSVGWANFDWNSDGELYYSVTQLEDGGIAPNIVITEPYNLNYSSNISFPPFFNDKTIFSLDVSNDSKKILLGIRDSGSLVDSVTTFVLDLETDEIYQPVIDIDSMNGSATSNSISGAQWSPDDNWIMFFYGGVQGAALAATTRAPAQLLVIPASSKEVVLDSNNPLIGEGVVRVQFNEIGLDVIGNNSYSNVWLPRYGHPWWTE